MEKIFPDELNELCRGTKLLQGTRNGPKVLFKNNSLIIKFIYKRKKIFSSSKIYPYAKRFKNNSILLLQLGIKCPKVSKIFKFQGYAHSKQLLGKAHTNEQAECTKTYMSIASECATQHKSCLRRVYPPEPCDVVLYSYVEGESLDKIVKANDYSVLEELADFIAFLHEKGVFFWDLHLGNILRQTEGAFYLLDIASVKVYKKPLSIYKRARNLSRLVEVEQKQRGDHTLISFGIDKFIDLYLNAVNMTARKENKLLKLIKKRLYANL